MVFKYQPAPIIEAPSAVRILDIQVAPDTPWQPAFAEQLMIGLFALPTPMRLAIESQSLSLHWTIMLPSAYVGAVRSAIYSYYPGAQISLRLPDSPPNPVHNYFFEGAAPFVLPLRHVADFTKFDPLAGFISAIDGIGPGTHIAYELVITPVRQEQVQLGQKIITQPRNRWWQYLTIDRAINAGMDKLAGGDKVERFRPDLQRLARTKLSSLLREATLAIRICGESKQSADFIFQRLASTLATFAREEANFLVSANPDSYPLILSPQEAASICHLPTMLTQSPRVTFTSKISAPLPVSLWTQQEGIVLGQNEFQSRSQRISLPDSDRLTHCNVVGKTGVGKSTLLHHMIHQDIAAGKGVGIIDPHGKLAIDIVAKSIPRHRENDVVLFDMTDTTYPVGLNFLKAPPNIPLETLASQSLAIIRKMFADSWSSSRMEDALYAALVTVLMAEDAGIQDIHRLFHDSAFRAQLLPKVRDPIALEFWYDEFEPSSPASQREMAKPISNRIRKFYRNETIRRVIAQHQSLDFRDILDNKKIFIANLGGLSDIEAETMGALLISKFQMAAMSRQLSTPNRTEKFYLYTDEVQNFVTTSLPQLFSEARKYGLHLTVANQYLSQLEGHTLEAILGNVGTTIIFRVGVKDANALASIVQPNFSASDLVNLNRFSAIVKMQLHGETLPSFSLETMAPLSLPQDARERFSRIRALSRVKYARHRDEVDIELARRYTGRHGQVRNGISDEDNTEDSFFG